RAFRGHPGNEAIREKLRGLYQELGEWSELAKVLLADAAAAQTAEHRFEALRRAGDVLLRAGDQTAALEPLERATEIRPTDHDTMVLLVDAYIAVGKLPDAAQKLEAAIAGHGRRRTPELAQLQHRMARL